MQLDRASDLQPAPPDGADAWAFAADEIERLRAACCSPAGGGAVLDAMRLIALSLPPDLHWLRDEYLRRYGRVKGAYVGSWDHDEAFGRPWPRHTRLAAERRRLRLKSIVHASVWRLVRENPNISITRALFDQVGEAREVGLAGAAVEALYYSALKNDGMLNIAQWRAASRAQRSIRATPTKAKDARQHP